MATYIAASLHYLLPEDQRKQYKFTVFAVSCILVYAILINVLFYSSQKSVQNALPGLSAWTPC